MSTATFVRQTHHLEGDDAKETLRRVGWKRLAKDSFTRFRAADGFAHVRAAAHAWVLTAFPALITVVGLATALNLPSLKTVLERTVQSLAPGPAGRLLHEAFGQGSRGGGASALVAGLVGFLVSGTFAMAAVERGCNRTYGLVRDRSLTDKLRVGLVLHVTAGVLLLFGFVLLAAGSALARALGAKGVWGSTGETVFDILRWPLGIGVVLGALTLIYKASPNRRQPGWAWLQTGTILATVLWIVFTVLLAAYYGLNDSLGQTYGPLLGIIALLTWAYATALAIFLGLAFSAQLEAVRAGNPVPRVERRENVPEAPGPEGAARQPV